MGRFSVTSYAQIERWWEMVMSAYLLVSLHTNSLHQPQPQPSTQRDAQPQAIVFKLMQRTGIRHGVETGVEQFALGNSALGDLKFASTLVESISIPRLSAGERLFDCVDESPTCHATPHADFHFSSA